MWGMISGFFGAVWGKVALGLTALAAITVAVLGWRWSIRKGAKHELSVQIQRRTLDRIERAKRAEERMADLGAGDVRERLRDKGLLRD